VADYLGGLDLNEDEGELVSVITLLPRLVLAVLVAGLAIPGATAAAVAPPATNVPVDPDTGAKGGVDATFVIRNLDPAGHYQLLVENTRGIGYVNGFRWVPPPGLTITGITGAEGGHCGLAANAIVCQGTLAPPICTCLPGGTLTVNFNATGVTPTVPRTCGGMTSLFIPIPSTPGQVTTPTTTASCQPASVPPHGLGSLTLTTGPAALDVPYCKGPSTPQTGTPASPCIPRPLTPAQAKAWRTTAGG
jgi:hypothetical protein